MDMFDEKKLKHRISDGNLMISSLDVIRLYRRSKDENEEQTSDNVIVKVGSKKIEANKNVLKERIPYFNGMFSNCFQESSQTEINLDATLDAKCVYELLNFVTKGTLKVSPEYVQRMFILTDLWGMESIKNMCVSLMISQMDSSSCLALLQLGEMHCCQKLTTECIQLISQEFQIVCQCEAFQELPSTQVITILQLDNLNLGPQGEDCVFNAVLRWYDYDTVGRQSSLVDLLHYINLPKVEKGLLQSLFSNLPDSVVEEIHSRIKPGTVSNVRSYKQSFMVCCGYSQSRTGPTCPRTNSIEVFDPESEKFHCTKFPEPPSYSVAFNLRGRIIFFATYLNSNDSTSKKTSNKKSYISKVFTYRQYTTDRDWVQTPELFSTEATDYISECLMKDGSVVYCPKKNYIYAIQTGKSVCIQVSHHDGVMFCDYKKDLPSLLTHLDATHSGLQGVCHQGRLYVMGGFFGPKMEREFSNHVLRLSEDGLTWECKQCMLIPRLDFSVISFGDKLIVSGGYGGRDQRRRHQSCESYNVAEDKWEPFPSMQQSRSGHCMVVANNLLFVIGGKSYASQKLTSEGGWNPGGARIVSDFVELYMPSSNLWQRVSRLHNARCNFCTVVI